MANMKGLRESLFDKDIVSKDITFRDLFELDEERSQWKHAPLDIQFSAISIRRLTKVSGDDKNEIIFKGFVKLVSDININIPPEEVTKEWLKGRLEQLSWFLFSSYMQRYKSVFVALYRKDRLVSGRDESVFDVDTVQVGFGPDLRIVFNRKR